ncbi:MAG: DUF3343 domain-containing protein [Clostridia bacterium]|nr:DUF3343 domain-containing protein [Clostridia bacterium]
MTEILAVFRSRSQAADCNSRLRMNSINCALINTPKEVGVGCGLSVKIPQYQLMRAKGIIMRGKYSAFYGFYTMKSPYGK